MNEKYDFLTPCELNYLNDRIGDYLMWLGPFADTSDFEEEVIDEIMLRRKYE